MFGATSPFLPYGFIECTGTNSSNVTSHSTFFFNFHDKQQPRCGQNNNLWFMLAVCYPNVMPAIGLIN